MFPSDILVTKGMETMGVCMRVGFGTGRGIDLVCHERLQGKSSVGHVARSRFIPIQRTIIVDLALPGKARVNRRLINQL